MALESLYYLFLKAETSLSLAFSKAYYLSSIPYLSLFNLSNLLSKAATALVNSSMFSTTMSNYPFKFFNSVSKLLISSVNLATSALYLATKSFLLVMASVWAYLTNSITSSTFPPDYKDKLIVTYKLEA